MGVEYIGVNEVPLAQINPPVCNYGPPRFGMVVIQNHVFLNKYPQHPNDVRLEWYLQITDAGYAFRVNCIVRPRGRGTRGVPSYRANSIMDDVTGTEDLPRAARFILRLRQLYDPDDSDEARRQVAPVSRAHQEALRELVRFGELTDESVFGAV